MISRRKTWSIYEGQSIWWLCPVSTTKNAAINFSNLTFVRVKRLSYATWSMNAVHKRGPICVSLVSLLSASAWSTPIFILRSSTTCLRSSTRTCTSWKWTSWGTERSFLGTCSTLRPSAGRVFPSSDSQRTIPPQAPVFLSKSCSKTSAKILESRGWSRDSRMKHCSNI